jgi:hypothetical protein
MNMSCANRECIAELKYLRGGRLFLMERQPNTPAMDAPDSSRPKRVVMMRRYFWLCESCSQSYSIQRWTERGIELAAKPKAKRMAMGATVDSRGWTMPGLVG